MVPWGEIAFDIMEEDAWTRKKISAMTPSGTTQQETTELAGYMLSCGKEMERWFSGGTEG